MAFPHSRKILAASARWEKVLIDQVVIGSCTNGRLEDLRMAEAAPGAESAPGSAFDHHPRHRRFTGRPSRGLGGNFPGGRCRGQHSHLRPLLDGHMGVWPKAKKAVSTTNRNFVGRMGHPESEVYLAGPAVAAASAVLGRIAGPESGLNVFGRNAANLAMISIRIPSFRPVI